MKSWEIFSALIALGAISLHAQAPLAGDISIEPPPPSVTRQAAAFSGACRAYQTTHERGGSGADRCRSHGTMGENPGQQSR